MAAATVTQMTVHNVYAGEATHKRGKHLHRFRPTGKITFHNQDRIQNPVTRISGGGYSARLFVGLNVGQRQKFTEKDVVDIVWRTRKKQGALADASILSQKGIYESRSGARVVEPSVQIIIIDLAGTGRKQFVADMTELGEVLRKKMKQETVILEIQKRGVVEDVYSITA